MPIYLFFSHRSKKKSIVYRRNLYREKKHRKSLLSSRNKKKGTLIFHCNDEGLIITIINITFYHSSLPNMYWKNVTSWLCGFKVKRNYSTPGSVTFFPWFPCLLIPWLFLSFWQLCSPVIYSLIPQKICIFHNITLNTLMLYNQRLPVYILLHVCSTLNREKQEKIRLEREAEDNRRLQMEEKRIVCS